VSQNVAAHLIVLHLTHLSFLPAYALGDAASVMTGQAVGARQFELVRAIGRRALGLACGYTAACTVAALALATALASAFASDPELVAVTERLVRIAALFMIADGAYVVAEGVLRGTGDVRYPAVVGVIASWALTPPLTWLLGDWAGLGAAGGWIGLCAEITVGAALLWRRIARDGWRASAERAAAPALPIAETVSEGADAETIALTRAAETISLGDVQPARG
jgi:MATE family multidrug resistance protein